MSLADDLRAGLTRKIGPLPVWAWGASGIAGVVIVRRLRSRSEGAVPSGSPIPMEGGTDVLPVDVTGRAPGTDWGGYPPPSSPVPQPQAPSGCTKPTRKPDCKRYAPRCCPSGWHLASKGPCAGRCVPNVGGD